nr:MAG TPA: hypothetical protein [Crassvirales sp.]
MSVCSLNNLSSIACIAAIYSIISASSKGSLIPASIDNSSSFIVLKELYPACFNVLSIATALGLPY